MTTRVSSYDQFKQVMAEKRGFILAGWNGDPAVEARVKEETKATIRVIAPEEREAACVVTGQKGREVYFAQAY
jgi:prolyl-tRNA synthetase